MWMPFAAVALTIVSALVVYDPSKFGLPADAGMIGLFVTVPAAVGLIWRWTAEKLDARSREIALFAAWGDRTPVIESTTDHAGSYRSAAKVERTARTLPLDTKLPPPTLKKVQQCPTDLALALEQIDGGKTISFFEIHPKIAYVAIHQNDSGSLSDWTTVLLKLDARGPSLELRPLVVGDPLPSRSIGFKDEEFAARFVIEGDDPKAVRAYLIPELRDELLENDDVHLLVQDKTMALTIYGAFDRARAMRLLDVADVFFAEYGAEGGPSLREALDAAVDLAQQTAGSKPKKKKKKKAPPPEPDAAPSEA